MTSLLWILLTTLALSAISLVGAFTLLLKENILKKIIHPLVAFSAGSLFGGAMLHLLPESIEKSGQVKTIFIFAIIGFTIFFLLEQFIHWHHCHRPPSEHKHPVTYMILLSDGVHNFIDGLAIGSAFIINTHLGFVTMIAIAMHEIPQELGDFGILLNGGWQKTKALLFNFLSGLTMVLGGLLTWFFAKEIDVTYLLPFAAGNFIYIAASDLIPEVKHRDNIKQNIIHFITFVLGLILMWSMTLFEA